MKRKILVVDDNAINRFILREALRDEYEVIEAVNGQDALSLIHRSHKLLSVVVLALSMEGMSGYDVLEKMRDHPLLAHVPIFVTSDDDDEDIEEKALLLGASGFIAKPYNLPIIKLRLRNVIRMHEMSSIVNTIQHDKLTHIYNSGTFISKAEKMIEERESGYYVLSCFDIDNFNLISDQYGIQKGDEVLQYIAEVLDSGITPIGGICCRISSDNFAALYPSRFMDSDLIRKIRRSASDTGLLISPITISVGRYLVNDKRLSIRTMFDRAILAARTVKGRYDVHVALYDDSMRERIVQEQGIVNEMVSALKDKQFEIWLQPQHNHASGAVIGAEALVRWRHPTKGIVPPGAFIPLFEQNGFIYELDKYVWEQTARLIKKWIRKGGPTLPVSVNISRYDIFHEDFFSTITGLVKKHNIPADLLRLEITESAFALAP